MDEKNELKMRIKLLQSLWDAIATMDEFTEVEKESVRTELRINEGKYEALSDQTYLNMEVERVRKYICTREAVLNKVFIDSDTNYDLMKIFVDEQKRLLRA